MIPTYQKLANEIESEVAGIDANTPILSERELEKKYNVSRMTVRKALDLLVDKGVLYRVQNVGTFVADTRLKKHTFSIQKLPTFDDEKEYNILFFDIKKNDPQVCINLEIDDQTQFIRVVRLTSKNKKVESLDELFLVKSMFNDADKMSIMDILRFDAQKAIGSIQQKYVPLNVPIVFARLLGVKINTPVIRVDSKIISQDGRVLAFMQAYMHPDSPVEMTF